MPGRWNTGTLNGIATTLGSGASEILTALVSYVSNVSKLQRMLLINIGYSAIKGAGTALAEWLAPGAHGP